MTTLQSNALVPLPVEAAAAKRNDRPDVVESESVAYSRQAARWQVLEDLLGGTPTMRDAGERWLPREPRESVEAYDVRRRRSFLYNAYKDTVNRVVSKPFSKSVTLQNAPESVTDLDVNVDGAGTDLTQFGRKVLWSAAVYGVTHILVDFPVTPPGATLADEREMNARPVFVHVTAPQVFAWRTEQRGGEEVLTHVRIKESRIESDGRYRDRVREYIRVYDEFGWELWRKRDDEPSSDNESQYELYREGTHTFGSVPLVTLYLNKTAPMLADPPLEELAWTNVEHWQSSSDQKNVLRFSRMGLIFMKGLSTEEVDQEIVIGPNRAIRVTSPNADMKYVEHSGSAIGAGRQDIMDVEERMVVLGLQPFMERTGEATATGRAIDESRAQSDVQAWIRAEENALRMAYENAGRWTDQRFELPEDFSVDIFNEFGLSLKAAENVRSLIDMRRNGDISRETFLNEVKRYGVLSDSLEVEEELARIETENEEAAAAFAAQNPQLGEPGVEPGEDEDEDESAGDGGAMPPFAGVGP